MKLITLFILLLILNSCSLEQNGGAPLPEELPIHESEKIQPKIEQHEEPKIFFDFDEVIHYGIEMYDDAADSLWENENRNSNEELLHNVVNVSDFPASLNEVNFLSKLTSIGFTKQQISEENLERFHTIFIEDHYGENYETTCIPYFRDLLVFKNQGQMIGFVKLCFDCNVKLFLGTDANPDLFTIPHMNSLFSILHKGEILPW